MILTAVRSTLRWMGSFEAMQFLHVSEIWARSFFDFFTSRQAFAVLLSILGYKLMRLSVERAGAQEKWDLQRLAMAAAPGAVLLVGAIIVILAQQDMFLVVVLQLCTLGAGSLFALFGYRLFSVGIRATSDVEARDGDRSLTLKNFAPGTLFALFGLIMISVALYQGLQVVSNFGSQAASASAGQVEAAQKLMQVLLPQLQPKADTSSVSTPTSTAYKSSTPNPDDTETTSELDGSSARPTPSSATSVAVPQATLSTPASSAAVPNSP